METLDQYLGYLNKLEGLPGVALVFISCIIAGYVWRLLQFKWFPNDAIPVMVIIWGAFAQSIMADARVTTMPFRVWFLRNVIVGAAIGFLAWMGHNLILSRIEDWITSKIPKLSNTTLFKAKPVTTDTETKP